MIGVEVCAFFGIKCNDDRDVIVIDLTDNGLYKDFPTDIKIDSHSATSQVGHVPVRMDNCTGGV
ncbi:hypothetical protein PROFUN_03596 [Planoprotostelium fungivorum]|uniref:Uncharacterized protein n=1 Tax=Planoprotostelium fungivorum TaxID=1890364 RepID=A0A2P6MSK3_9EUKA|nr:hypothetical protein PROFUN_03596 [Planoprotostelium fungivorum]